MTRNKERYELLKWAQMSFDNFQVVPPNSGISTRSTWNTWGRVVMKSDSGSKPVLFP
ncbi:MAG: hypothetical protein U5K27_01950 [Desulfotignum sp.]|nr:hypothetical protein [Desulfotignum sp.]